MSKEAAEELPPNVVPCAAFVMSDAFRDWAVGEMRKEVAGLVSMAGLDRMAMIKQKGGGQGKPEPGKPAGDANGASPGGRR